MYACGREGRKDSRAESKQVVGTTRNGSLEFPEPTRHPKVWGWRPISQFTPVPLVTTIQYFVACMS